MLSSLSSPSYLVRNPILAPHLEKMHKTPPCVVRKKPAGSTHSSASGLSSREQLERQAEFHSSDKTRHDSPVPTLQGPCDQSQKWRRILRFLPPLEMRPSSIAPNPVESREGPPNSRVSLTSQRHTEKLPEATGTSRGNPGFTAVTQETP